MSAGIRLKRPLRFSTSLWKVNFAGAFIGERWPHRSHDVGVIRRSPVAGSVDAKDYEARFEEPLRPSRATIGCIQPFGALQRAAVHQHHGIGLSDVLRGFPGYVHRTLLEIFTVLGNTGAGHPEVATPRTFYRCASPGLLGMIG